MSDTCKIISYVALEPDRILDYIRSIVKETMTESGLCFDDVQQLDDAMETAALCWCLGGDWPTTFQAILTVVAQDASPTDTVCALL